MTKKLGWVVEADTSRPGCDASERHQRWLKRDADRLAAEIREQHAGDDCHSVSVRRETRDDQAQSTSHYDT
jgi:hypothetical protein